MNLLYEPPALQKAQRWAVHPPAPCKKRKERGTHNQASLTRLGPPAGLSILQPQALPSVGRPAAIDSDGLAIDERALLRVGEKRYGIGDMS